MLEKNQNVLIANRGEIAVRIARAAKSLGLNPISIFASADSDSLHTKLTYQALELTGYDSDPVSAYLDIEQIVNLAIENECQFVHPGYGFLSENSEFAAKCTAEGINFIGPSSKILELFGDKVRASSSPWPSRFSWLRVCIVAESCFLASPSVYWGCDAWAEGGSSGPCAPTPC